MAATYGPRDIAKIMGKSRNILTISELNKGTHNLRRYNLRDDRFEDG